MPEHEEKILDTGRGVSRRELANLAVKREYFARRANDKARIELFKVECQSRIQLYKVQCKLFRNGNLLSPPTIPDFTNDLGPIPMSTIGSPFSDSRGYRQAGASTAPNQLASGQRVFPTHTT